MEDISLQRLANQRFQDISFSNAKQVVEWFGAIQGQEYSLTKWGIGLRAPKLLDDDIEQELTKGRILRTHVLRPTWHLVSANDIRWMLKLTAPGVHQVSAYMLRSLSLDKKVFGKANNILEKILEGRSRTRDEINKEFKNNKIIASGPRLAYIFMNAELEGLICSGPRIGKQFSYALLDERCKPTPPLLRDEALTRLAEIYFTSRGPATVHDFATWSGLKISDCKRGIAASNKVKEELIGGRAYHLPKLRRSVDPSPGMLLLPIYDEMIMGYKDRTPMFQYQKKVAPKIDLSFNSMIMWKGQVIGTWRRVDEGVIKTQFRFFKRMDRAQKASFNESFDRLVSFSQRKVEKEIL